MIGAVEIISIEFPETYLATLTSPLPKEPVEPDAVPMTSVGVVVVAFVTAKVEDDVFVTVKVPLYPDGLRPVMVTESPTFKPLTAV